MPDGKDLLRDGHLAIRLCVVLDDVHRGPALPGLRGPGLLALVGPLCCWGLSPDRYRCTWHGPPASAPLRHGDRHGGVLGPVQGGYAVLRGMDGAAPGHGRDAPGRPFAGNKLSGHEGRGRRRRAGVPAQSSGTDPGVPVRPDRGLTAGGAGLVRFSFGSFPLWAVGICTAGLVLMFAYLVSKSAEATDQSG